MQISQSNSINFRANLVGKCKNLKLYQVTNHSDINALDKLVEKTDFNELMPNITRQEGFRWHEMLELAVDYAKDPGDVSCVAVADNKICGIVSYFPNATSCIDCICTIPTEIGKKVKYAGKALFCRAFKDLLDIGTARIKISAITDGPYDTVKKYQELGFKKTTDVTKTYVDMEMNKYKAKETLNMLKEMLSFEEKSGETVDLNEFIA